MFQIIDLHHLSTRGQSATSLMAAHIITYTNVREKQFMFLVSERKKTQEINHLDWILTSPNISIALKNPILVRL